MRQIKNCKSGQLLLAIFLLATTPVVSFSQTAKYKLLIRNHTDQGVFDMKMELENHFLQYGPTIRMTENNGIKEQYITWNHGDPFHGKVITGGDQKEYVHFNLKGTYAIDKNKFAEIELSFNRPRDVAFTDSLIKGAYMFTDYYGKLIPGVKHINDTNNYNSDVDVISLMVSPNPNDPTGYTRFMTDKEYLTLYRCSIVHERKESSTTLGSYQGDLWKGAKIKHDFEYEEWQPGDSVKATWEVYDEQTQEWKTVVLGVLVNKGTIYSPGESVDQSKGESNSIYIPVWGGPGVTITCEQIQDALWRQEQERWEKIELEMKTEWESSETTKLKFTRTGRGPKTGGTEDTVSFIIRSGDFRPTLSWTTGDGHFDASLDSITLPVTISRPVPDDDWVYLEVLSGSLIGSNWFHFQVSGTSNTFNLPVTLESGQLAQFDSLSLVVHALRAYSSPDTLTIYLDKAAGLDAFMWDQGVSIACYPNPIRDEVHFEYALTSTQNVLIRILTQQGQIITSQNEGIQTAGKHKTKLNMDGISEGVYYYIFSAGANQISGRMIKLR